MSRLIKEWCVLLYDYAKSQGFHDKPRSVLESLVLLHSEISEALEGWRNGDDENFKEEIADLAIRLFETCELMKIDLEEEIRNKYHKNVSRSYMHGGKKL